MDVASWLLICSAYVSAVRVAERTAGGFDRPFVMARAAAGDALAPIRRVGYQSGGRSARLEARWVGQDGHDYVGPSSQAQPSDVQDVHIALSGLDPGREIVLVDVTGHGGDQWRFEQRPPCWRAELKRTGLARNADLFVEPSRVETGRPFHVVVRYDDGSSANADMRGGKADPNLRTAGAALAARWIGQDRQDRTGAGPSVGADGVQDARIHLSRLSPKVGIKAVQIASAAGGRWESGTNPALFSNAELVRDPKDPAQADLYFQPERKLGTERLKVSIAYENEKLDSTFVSAVVFDPKLLMPQIALPRFNEGDLEAKWLGQDGQSPSGQGDVHVVISGLPDSSPIVGAVLSDSVRVAWIYRATARVQIAPDPGSEPLMVKARSDRKSADLFFRPYRDESKVTLTLRFIVADGRNWLVRFPGGRCELDRIGPPPAPTRIVTKPGDDLQALVEGHGTVVLSPGTYRLGSPLVLNHPVTLTSDGGATLVFAQESSAPTWTTALKVHCGNTTLNGFAVRFAGPIRWNNETAGGPAVLGMTDNLDQGHDEPKFNVTFTRLDLETPPVEDRGQWPEVMRLMRLLRAKSGTVAENRLRGGSIEFYEGPWRMIDNDYRGALPGTYSHGIFQGHGTHDILIAGNKTSALEPSGKTWRFLVLTWFGAHDTVERNTVDQLGARDLDTIPWTNEPEIIVTEAYHVKYEGRVLARSQDGRLVRTGLSLGAAVRTGDAVALLDGPAAGEWRLVSQAIDATSYLVDPPIPAGTEVISISTGFVSEVFRENRIDIRGGRKSDGLAFIGNHFGTQVVNNHVLGGAHAFRMTACPSETPVRWGWTHVPFLGGLIEGNILEDAEFGSVLGLEHDPRYIKSNSGRAYMSVTLRNNVVRWSTPFLNRLYSTSDRKPPVGLTLGYAPSHDPGELIVAAAGNHLDAAGGRRHGTPLLIHAALYNSKRIKDRKFSLPLEPRERQPAAQ